MHVALKATRYLLFRLEHLHDCLVFRGYYVEVILILMVPNSRELLLARIWTFVRNWLYGCITQSRSKKCILSLKPRASLKKISGVSGSSGAQKIQKAFPHTLKHMGARNTSVKVDYTGHPISSVFKVSVLPVTDMCISKYVFSCLALRVRSFPSLWGVPDACDCTDHSARTRRKESLLSPLNPDRHIINKWGIFCVQIIYFQAVIYSCIRPRNSGLRALSLRSSIKTVCF